MPYATVTYTYQASAEAMAEIRGSHREFLQSHEGLRLSGPYASGEGALLIFEADAGELEAWLDDDPFWKAGFISERAVEEWLPATGPWKEPLGLG